MPVQLTVYTRVNCHLCDDMKELLSGLSGELEFMVEDVKIDDNPVLEEMYGTRVPVLMLGDAMICEYFLDRLALEKAIAEYANEKHS